MNIPDKQELKDLIVLIDKLTNPSDSELSPLRLENIYYVDNPTWLVENIYTGTERPLFAFSKQQSNKLLSAVLSDIAEEMRKAGDNVLYIYEIKNDYNSGFEIRYATDRNSRLAY